MSRRIILGLVALVTFVAPGAVPAADETITVRAGQRAKMHEPFLSGACLEDVNHEVYGGLYSQMVFGESFQEPAALPPVTGFVTLGGAWDVRDGVLSVDGTDGPKLLAETPALADGRVAVGVRFDDRDGDNAGLLLRTTDARTGADAFDGYEVSLDPRRNVVRLARHRHNYELLRDAPCDVPVGRWATLEVALDGPAIDVRLDGRPVLRYDTGDTAAGGRVGLRAWNKRARFRDLRVIAGGVETALPFRRESPKHAVSGMWTPVVRGSAAAEFALTTDRPFAGRQSQAVRFVAGDGEVGVANRSLNGWGMRFVAGRPYDGYVWLRADAPTRVVAALEADDGRTYAGQTLDVPAGDWRRVELSLTPTESDDHGRLTLTLKRPGGVTFGHAFLQPGAWGRYKGLPVRRDVVEALVEQGVTVLRYGGSMANHAEYRWRNMTGPRDRRPPTAGHWYRWSSNGWAVPDFLDLCEAMNVLAIPDLNVNETPADIGDFVEYVNGPADTAGGARRVADGHPKPYGLRHLQLGNEESVDDAYADKFIALADAAWAKDPALILVVGDFAYPGPIADPDRLPPNAGRIANMNAHRRILSFAKSRGGEVWFDVHTWSERPDVAADLAALPSYVDAIDKLADGARHRVAVFELNAFSHHLGRALANARSVNRVRRDGRLPVVIAANCLQPDGQNDNGWDQGLIFLNPSKVWLQPAAYVTQMQARSRQPVLVPCDTPRDADLDVTASRSDDGKTLVVEIVNVGVAKSVDLALDGFTPERPTADRVELSGPPDAVNTADAPTRVAPKQSRWPVGVRDGKVSIVVPAHAFTVLRFE